MYWLMQCYPPWQYLIAAFSAIVTCSEDGYLFANDSISCIVNLFGDAHTFPAFPYSILLLTCDVNTTPLLPIYDQPPSKRLSTV